MERTVLDYHDMASREFDRRMHAIGRDDWDQPTPCTEWDVRTLVNHLVGEAMWVPALLSGRTVEDVGDAFDGDLLGGEPVAAWNAASEAATTSLHVDGALEGTVHLSYGDSPAESYAWELTSDLALHAWDLARAVGAEEQLDPQLVDVLLARIAPVADRLAASGVFGPPVTVPDDADPQTRLLALVGRRA